MEAALAYSAYHAPTVDSVNFTAADAFWSTASAAIHSPSKALRLQSWLAHKLVATAQSFPLSEVLVVCPSGWVLGCGSTDYEASSPFYTSFLTQNPEAESGPVVHQMVRGGVDARHLYFRGSPIQPPYPAAFDYLKQRFASTAVNPQNWTAPPQATPFWPGVPSSPLAVSRGLRFGTEECRLQFGVATPALDSLLTQHSPPGSSPRVLGLLDNQVPELSLIMSSSDSALRLEPPGNWVRLLASQTSWTWSSLHAALQGVQGATHSPYDMQWLKGSRVDAHHSFQMSIGANASWVSVSPASAITPGADLLLATAVDRQWLLELPRRWGALSLLVGVGLLALCSIAIVTSAHAVLNRVGALMTRLERFTLLFWGKRKPQDAPMFGDGLPGKSMMSPASRSRRSLSKWSCVRAHAVFMSGQRTVFPLMRRYLGGAAIEQKSTDKAVGVLWNHLKKLSHNSETSECRIHFLLNHSPISLLLLSLAYSPLPHQHCCERLKNF